MKHRLWFRTHYFENRYRLFETVCFIFLEYGIQNSDSPEFNIVAEDVVRKGISIIEETTCLTFKEVSETETDNHIIYFSDGTGGCWSFVGMLPRPGQNVAIGKRCAVS